MRPVSAQADSRGSYGVDQEGRKAGEGREGRERSSCWTSERGSDGRTGIRLSADPRKLLLGQAPCPHLHQDEQACTHTLIHLTTLPSDLRPPITHTHPSHTLTHLSLTHIHSSHTLTHQTYSPISLSHTHTLITHTHPSLTHTLISHTHTHTLITHTHPSHTL